MAQVGQLKITENNELFTKGTYNEISIIIRNNNKFVNATKLCKQNNKDFYRLADNRTWKEYIEEFKKEYGCTEKGATNIVYELRKNYSKDVKGQYINPRLVNYVAVWASPRYAVNVSKIMDTINDLVHVELKKDNLNDCPANASPTMEKIEKSLKDILTDEINELENKFKFDSGEWRNLMSKHSAMNDDGIIDEREHEHMTISLSDNLF
jgi:hypothetical protein